MLTPRENTLAALHAFAWDRVGDANDNRIDPSPQAIDVLPVVWPIFEVFQLIRVSKSLLLEQEKTSRRFR